LKPKLNINESFICRIWEGGSEYYKDLQSDSGEDIEIIFAGRRNYDAGPDYRDAKVKIGDKILTGDIEIHREYSNWIQHDHHNDRRYNPVILHVVLWDSEKRTPPRLRIKRDVPTIILSNYLTRSIHEIWKNIISEPSEKFRLPCFEKNTGIKDDELLLTIKKYSIERLKLRAERIKHRLNELSGTEEICKRKQPWEQALYEFIFEALGFSKNKEQMQRLAASADLKTLSKYSAENKLAIQAILYGTSGLLFDVRSKHPYIDGIKEIWKSLNEKLGIARLQRSDWVFYGQRPQNYPTLRIAYGSQVVNRIIYKELLRAIVVVFEDKEFKIRQAILDIHTLFEPAGDEFWNSHYDFCKSTSVKNILAGRQRITDIIINVLIPYLYLYSVSFGSGILKKNVLKLYNELHFKTDNSVLRVMNTQLLQSRNIKLNTPAIEQGLIQMHNFYCTREKCEKCAVGKNAFKQAFDKVETGFEYKIIYY
jgi:hypothetical protein